MIVLVTGAAASGKSAFAEQVACALGPARCYIATMRAWGPDAPERIARHHALRRGKGFDTIECPFSLEPALADERTGAGAVVLLEDLGNLVANALFADDGSMADPAEALAVLEADVRHLAQRCDHLVVVGNEIGSDGAAPTPETPVYARTLGALGCKVGALADCAVEVVSGMPMTVKGSLASIAPGRASVDSTPGNQAGAAQAAGR